MMDVDALTAHIRAQLHQDPTPAQIAAHFGVNRFALSRWFRAETGLSLRDYIAALKIEQGIAPLVQGQPVIASQLEAGHASAATFSHRFRAHTGQSPRDYRAQAASTTASAAYIPRRLPSRCPHGKTRNDTCLAYFYKIFSRLVGIPK